MGTGAYAVFFVGDDGGGGSEWNGYGEGDIIACALPLGNDFATYGVIGGADRIEPGGEMRTDYDMLEAGDGFIVVDAGEVVGHPSAYIAEKYVVDGSIVEFGAEGPCFGEGGVSHLFYPKSP